MIRRTRRLLCSLAATAALATVAVAPQPAAAAGLRIYPLGDSITYGATYTVARPADVPPAVFNGQRVDTPGGYRFPLSVGLTAAQVEHTMVGVSTDNSNAYLDQQGQNHHDGHPGYRIDQVAAALDGFSGGGSDKGGHWLTGTATRAAIHPDVVVIHLGTNDINQKYDPGTTYAAPGGKADYANPAQRALFVQHLTARLGALVNKVQALRPGARIVLSSVAPWDAAPQNQVTYEYRIAVQALVGQERAAGDDVVYADVWGAMAASTDAGIVVVPGLLSPDKVHPTPAGYDVIAGVYLAALLGLPQP